MSSGAPHLLVDPVTGELLEECPDCAERGRELIGLKETLDWQLRRIGSLREKLEVFEDGAEAQQEAGKAVTALFKRWQRATNHPRAKLSLDRRKLIGRKLKESYSVEDLECAIDGLAAFPFRVYGKPRREGNERDDQLSVALKSGERVEEYANLGCEARRNGWVTW